MTHFQVIEVLEDLLKDGLYNLKEDRKISKYETLAIERAIAIIRRDGCRQHKQK